MRTSTRYIHRYDDKERIGHWFIALMFLLAAFSGLALFHPSLFFLSALVGGGSWARILHPYIGVLMTIGFVWFFLRLWRDNIVTDADRRWRAGMARMLRGDKKGLPAVGKYNYGQKMLFWSLTVCLIVLLVTGIMFWRPWFEGAFPIPLQRFAVLLHAVAAFVLTLAVIVHIYAAIWTKGSIRAMTRGTVTESWARYNHAAWHDEVSRRPPSGQNWSR